VTVSWADAHRLGALATSRLLRELDIDVQQRIPIFGIPERLGVVLRAGPLPRLAGAYIAEPGADPGILVNNRHPIARQRYTVAHEIGHHVLEHSTSLDADTELDPGGVIPDHERMAEAFAAWLLMPRRTVYSQIERLACDATSTEGAYQLSLSLGASYAATVRQLSNLRVIDRSAALSMLKVTPASIKRAVMGSPFVGVGAGDVHVVDAPLSTAATVGPRDLLVVRLPGQVRTVDTGGLGDVVDIDEVQPGQSRVRVRVRPVSPTNPSTPATLHDMAIATPSGDLKVAITVEPLRHGVPETWF
jgi:hypothetical protein